MTDEEKIEQLTQQLKELHLVQEWIIRELETLTNRDKNKNKVNTPDATGAELLVGDKIQVVNRRRFRERSGTVTKIGKLVSIRLDTGQMTTRKSTNLFKQMMDAATTQTDIPAGTANNGSETRDSGTHAQQINRSNNNARARANPGTTQVSNFKGSVPVVGAVIATKAG
jgi:uncharacterized Zn ribbon protein